MGAGPSQALEYWAGINYGLQPPDVTLDTTFPSIYNKLMDPMDFNIIISGFDAALRNPTSQSIKQIQRATKWTVPCLVGLAIGFILGFPMVFIGATRDSTGVYKIGIIFCLIFVLSLAGLIWSGISSSTYVSKWGNEGANQCLVLCDEYNRRYENLQVSYRNGGNYKSNPYICFLILNGGPVRKATNSSCTIIGGTQLSVPMGSPSERVSQASQQQPLEGIAVDWRPPDEVRGADQIQIQAGISLHEAPPAYDDDQTRSYSDLAKK